jgi:energy-coupling factor transporter transmembrane protein EcfT
LSPSSSSSFVIINIVVAVVVLIIIVVVILIAVVVVIIFIVIVVIVAIDLVVIVVIVIVVLVIVIVILIVIVIVIWLSLKTPPIESGDPPGAPLAALAMTGVGLGDLGNSNMCNKTCISLSVAPHILPSSGEPPRTVAPGRILFPTGNSGNHNIRSFLPSRNLTPHRVAVAQSVTPAIALH